MLCSVLNLFVILTHFNGSSMWWNANQVLKNFIQSAFFGVPKAVHLNITDGWSFGKVRSTDAGILHLAPWRTNSLFSQGRVHESQPFHRCLRDSRPLSPVNLISRNAAAHLSLHNCTAGHVRMTGSVPEPQSEGLSKTRVISTWASRNKSIPGFKQKVEFLSRKNWGETSVVFFFCWSNPLFQTSRESGISKERLSFFNPLSWPIATALLQDSYESCRNMNVMERSC